ncbi:ABC transporter substrate-binding protein [Rhodoblastus acidophilus]|uniref:ABC transporter substrate-binding protein n=1 Tax=Candidatus Rhodoblastus alkanivorans TaxID=2954117 RepID=A0ABS9Z7Z4_9HYPH|nr:CmpA/NrtA family ABC transporter substrate-binding protein [Candidatus Rhodoblastus alkanivorans]MCI4678970.1 ABC transporter substrate-binding protein [Candidatus Rhodoblastus alkanivorans]MCI4683748.1 ABC transporter substrate-binding protein [Candidatus Rhodoblastus alkanivorans]MDI4641066.1 ABC transporter substrate-binding protein [Rhodoblastus acidophilus]
MTRPLRIGYMPLTDAGLLFVAAAKGFDHEEGLVFDLRPETSWANLRDKLALGIYDAAHMLAPVVIASTLGLEGFAAPMIGAVALGLDGNAISVAPPLADCMREKAKGDFADPAVTARALAAVVAERRNKVLPNLRFAHVFPYSTHHYQLKLWMRLGGVDLEGVRMTVTPPPLMGESLRGGFVNGFCVGEPWNSLARDAGEAEILHPCRALTPDCPEKVLAFRADAAGQEKELPRAAARAVRRAALWGESPENKKEFCFLVAEGLGGGVTPAMVATVLGRDGRSAPWLRLDADSTALSGMQALWLYVLIAANRQSPVSEEFAGRAREAFWPQDGAPPAPSAPAFFDGPFAEADWRDVLAALSEPQRGDPTESAF